MLSWVLTGVAEADVNPGLGVGVTGLGGPSGTRLGLPGCGGGPSEAEDDEEEEEVVVVADKPNLGEAMCALWEQWPSSTRESGFRQSQRKGRYLVIERSVWKVIGKSVW